MMFFCYSEKVLTTKFALKHSTDTQFSEKVCVIHSA